MVRYAWEYQWSSAAYYCGLSSSDILVKKDELLAEINDWQEFLGVDSEMSLLLEEKNHTGRPFGSDDFYYVVEKITGYDTRPGKPGRPAKKQ
jgi:hypothetical protein